MSTSVALDSWFGEAHLCRFARDKPWPVQKWFVGDRVTKYRSKRWLADCRLIVTCRLLQCGTDWRTTTLFTCTRTQFIHKCRLWSMITQIQFQPAMWITAEADTRLYSRAIKHGIRSYEHVVVDRYRFVTVISAEHRRVSAAAAEAVPLTRCIQLTPLLLLLLLRLVIVWYLHLCDFVVITSSHYTVADP